MVFARLEVEQRAELVDGLAFSPRFAVLDLVFDVQPALEQRQHDEAGQDDEEHAAATHRRSRDA